MIAPKQVKILEALGRYKFLSRSQFARLGIEQYNSNYTKYSKPLLERKLIGVIDARPYDLGFIYYLKERGAKIISEHLQTNFGGLNYVKSEPTLSPQTLYHRKYAIDCQIELFKSCETNGIEIDFYERDIETIGSLKKDKMLQRKTRVPINKGQFLEPDAIFRIITPKGRKLYCFELENATFTKKSFEKIMKHVRALNMKSPSQKYNHEKAHRVLMVYKDAGIMKSVMSKMEQHLTNINKWFLFKSYDDVATPVSLKKSTFTIADEKDFFSNWLTLNGTYVPMY
ncbi:MAG: hypothetical protein AAF502_25255 [Bacteroidota bacterium]